MIRPACLGLLLLAACEAHEPVLSPDWIVDSADLLTAEQESELIALLLNFHEQTQVELAAVTVAGLPGRTIEAYAAELFDNWELGTLQTNNGILVMLALEERQVYIARGMGINWQIPQPVVDSLITVMASEFGEARYAAGFEAGLRRIMEIASSVPWTTDYLSVAEIRADGEAALAGIASLEVEITGFDDDRVITADPEGQTVWLQMPVSVPLLSVDDLLGLHGRVVSISPLELQVLGLEVDEPL
ncbi:MAG: TPM domain-containing protein [Bacteroidota bacterium]|nr:TPM domain-containing protein [Bacteroidota bacterium]